MQGRLEIHTFGGFEARRGEARANDFESRKVEALAAYLLSNRGRTFSRDHLASLLWPDRDETSARRNLRQALYNLRSTLEREATEPCFVVDARSVRFELRHGDWIDLEPFEKVLMAENGDTAVDPRGLASAVRLYRGQFLHGLQCPGIAYEEWLLGEQERYREAVLRALRDLVDHALATGDYEAGIRYARQLVRIDPLSEEAHRQLIRLYALSGRRGRALAHYDELVDRLHRELGVSPLDETTELYQSIRESRIFGAEIPAAPEPTGPVLPMVGRARELSELDELWHRVLEGRGRLTLVTGAEGVGKTRLVKTFLHRASSESGATVLQGAWHELEPPVPYRGLRQVLDELVSHELDAVDRILDGTPPEELALLAQLAPDLTRTQGAAPTHPRHGGRVSKQQLARAFSRAIALTARSEDGTVGPTILYLEDLHWADRSSLDLLAALCPLVEEAPVWVVATARPGSEGARLLGALPGAEALALEPLAHDDMAELVRALVGADGAEHLTELLGRTGGNALAASSLVNLLWDHGVLEPVEDGGWHVTATPVAGLPAGFPALPGAALDSPAAIDKMIAARVARLPPSSRRLLTLAAVAGPRFEPDLLGAIEGEEEAVIEASLRTLLERWLVRLSLGYWADSRRDRDMVMWVGGARRGTFEFAHGAVHRAIYERLDPVRRRALHLKVAAALERTSRVPFEVLAHHYLAGGANERAVALLLKAAALAESIDAHAEAVYARDLASSASRASTTASSTAVSQPSVAERSE